MEPILNEHEVIKFLVSKGGRCTNFELVSNFRGVLNHPHSKAEARLKFKDIINTVATVGEFQNVKYIELKKEHCLNNGTMEPSSLDSYTSPLLTQTFQPYWRFHRLSTSKLPPPSSPSPPPPPRSAPSYHRSASEYHPQGTTEDQVVPQEYSSMPAEWESEQTTFQSLPFHPTRPRVASGPPSDHRRYSSDGIKQIGQQHVRLQDGYQFPEHQSDRHHQPRTMNPHIEQNYDGSLPQQIDPIHQRDVRLSHASYQYPEHQPHSYQHIPRQHSAGQHDARVQKYPDFRASGYQHHEQHAGRQQQYSKQEVPRYQQVENQHHVRRHPAGERQAGTQNFHKLEPPDPRVHRSSSVRQSGDSTMDEVFRTKPEPSIARKIESLHGIRSNECAKEYSSLPYESPSSYHLSDISPHARNEPLAEDLQTSANLRNVARALFKDPSRTSKRDDNTNPRQNTDRNSTSLSHSNSVKHSQRSSHSLPSPAAYMEDGNLYFSPSNGRQDHRPANAAGPNLSTEHSSSAYSSPSRTSSMDRVHISPGSTDSSRGMSRPVVTSKIQCSSDLSMDISNSSFRPEEPTSPARPVNNSTRLSSSDTSSCSNLDSEKELSNMDRDSTPLPPDRRKKTDDKGDDKDNKVVGVSGVCKVRDRVQHFDEMEKRRNTKRTHSPPLTTTTSSREKNTITHKGMGLDDDVSISVIEPKLKREWFVKAAQCDYHALSGLLKKEPKLAALKDPAMTCLHWAAKQGDANVVKLIAGAYKVSPNIRSGYTPVHLATLYKHEMIVHLLVHTYGADASVRDYSGKRADQYPENYVKGVAGHNIAERRPLKQRSADPQPKETSVGNSFMRIGSLNLRKSSRKSTVFASVRGSTRNWGSAAELRIGGHSMRKKLHKSMIPAHEKIGEVEKKNDSDSDSTYGFPSKKQNS